MTVRAGLAAVVVFSIACFLPHLSRGLGLRGATESVVPPWSAVPVEANLDASATDALIYSYPNLVHWQRAVAGDWTGLFWNPHLFCGTPFLATLDTCALYPTNALSLVLPPGAFLLAVALIHVLLANVGAYLALLRLRIRPSSALLGACAFGASPWFLAHLDVVNFPQAAAWLPWMALFADRLLADGRVRDAAGLAACLAVSILGGMIQITGIAVVCVLMLAAARVVTISAHGGRRRAALRVAAAILAGLALAAPQLAPTVEHGWDAPRVTTSAGDALRFAHRPLEWLQLLYPEILGTPADLSRFGAGSAQLLTAPSESTYPPAALAGSRGPGMTFTESVCGPGVVALALALAALASSERKRALPFLLLIAIGALASSDSPLTRLVFQIPGSTLGNPKRFLLACCVGFAGCAALGAEALADRRRGARIAAVVPAFAIVLFCASIAAVPDLVEEWLARAVGCDVRFCRGVAAVLLTQAALPAGVAIATAVVARAHRLGPFAGHAILAGLALVSAASFNANQNPGHAERRLFPSTVTTRYIAARANRSDDVSPFRAAATTPFRIARFRGATARVPAPLPPNTAILFGFRDLQGYEGLVPPRLEELLTRLQADVVFEHHMVREWSDARVLAKPVFHFLGVRLVLSSNDEVPGLPTSTLVPEENVGVFENWSARPLASCVTSVRTFESDPALLDALVGDEFLPGREVLVLAQDASALHSKPQAGGVDSQPAAPTVRWKQTSAGVIDLSWEGDLPGPLVVAESFSPGWRAETPDGASVKILRANHAFMAMTVPAGSRSLTLHYVPRAFFLGLGIACLGLGALGLSGILSHRRSRRSL